MKTKQGESTWPARNVRRETQESLADAEFEISTERDTSCKNEGASGDVHENK
jgi:hypothetical protein